MEGESTAGRWSPQELGSRSLLSPNIGQGRADRIVVIDQLRLHISNSVGLQCHATGMGREDNRNGTATRTV